jgi:hypothetical protein
VTRGHVKSALAALLVTTAALACGERSSGVRGDLTGVELLVSYEPAAGLDQLLISGSMPGGAVAFAPGLVPEQPRPLVDGADSVVILLPDSMGGVTLTLHVDGLVSGSAALAGDSSVLLETESLVEAGITLASMTPTPTPTPVTTCSNSIDDDGDGQSDFPADPGCESAEDMDERGTLVCDDGIDQDEDTFADFPADPGCTNVNDTSELGPPARECDNGNDDDGDLLVDYPDDPECSGPDDMSEN